MTNFLKAFLADESGASAAEYALILAVVGVAIGGAALLLAEEVGDAIGESAGKVDACTDAANSATLTDTDCAKPTGYTDADT